MKAYTLNELVAHLEKQKTEHRLLLEYDEIDAIIHGLQSTEKLRDIGIDGKKND